MSVQGLTPRQIVAYLDEHIVGQAEAKKCVAIALRNRARRMNLPADLAAEVTPKNILMVGPTGVGKTEIARRLAKLVGAPFVKVEATKFTEVGYVGRDVESMVRDLAERAFRMVQERMVQELRPQAGEAALERMVDFLVPGSRPSEGQGIPTFAAFLKGAPEPSEPAPSKEGTRGKMRRLLEEGKLDDREVEIEVVEKRLDYAAEGNVAMINMNDMLAEMMPAKKKRLKVKVKEGLELLGEEEAERLVDKDKAGREALRLAAEEGIIFIDEIDKVCKAGHHGADVSREGVQRDLLPIVEGTVVRTKWGPLPTDHILFIAAGAFQMSSPSDLVPELQGRLPLRVELKSLGAAELARILEEPKHSLVAQYQALMATEGVDLIFDASAAPRIAELAEHINRESENIGARRLHTLMERLLEEVSYAAEDYRGTLTIDADYVNNKLASLAQDADLSRYLL